jgi:hypothetical protein
MKKQLFKSFLVGLFMLGLSGVAQAGPIYTYIGSWRVSDGPGWGSNPLVYTGQETAAYLFGGSAGDYAISTISSDPSQINFLTYLDGWADAQYSSNPQPQDWKVDLGNPGYNDPGGSGSAYSAYVSDHAVNAVNYAFKIDSQPIPEPASMLLLGTGIAGLAAARKRKNRVSET